MAQERRNPLPIGRYWVYVPEDKLEFWQAWLAAHPSVQSRAAEALMELVDRSWIWSLTPAALLPGDQGVLQRTAGYWILFDVTSPVPWNGPGFPTIVTDLTITRAAQVVQAPDLKDTPKTGLEKFFDSLGTAGVVVVWGGAGIILYKLFQMLTEENVASGARYLGSAARSGYSSARSSLQKRLRA